MKIIKDKRTFYTLSFTWGIIMTIIGLYAALYLLIRGYKASKHGYCWCFSKGVGWGGVSLGFIMIKSIDCGDRTKNHEHGHAIQNCYFGPLHCIFSLMSAARYHYRKHLVRCGELTEDQLPDYDEFWFEGQATEVGEEQMKYLNRY